MLRGTNKGQGKQERGGGRHMAYAWLRASGDAPDPPSDAPERGARRA
jgi:hypothetical protein